MIKDLEKRRASARAAVNRYNRKYPERVKATRKKSRDAWKLRDPHGYAFYRRKMDLARKGLTFESFDALYVAQGGCCAICSGRFGPEKSNVPHIDHDHRCCPGGSSCGHCVRGLLCGHCNMGLGRFRDDPAKLAAAISYLLR